MAATPSVQGKTSSMTPFAVFSVVGLGLVSLIAIVGGIVWLFMYGLSWAVVGVVLLGLVGDKLFEVLLKHFNTQGLAGHLATLPNFTPSQQLIAVDGQSGIAIDESRGEICLIKYGATGIDCRVIPYSDVFAVEIFQDGKSVTRTIRASQIGGAVMGGVALGGAGAMIGGLSGSTTTSETIIRIDLRLVVNDIDAPLHDITLMSSESEKGGYMYAQAMKVARRWKAIMEVVIRRSDAEDRR